MTVKKQASELPRRCDIGLMTQAELEIFNAIQEVERLGADVRLTNAVILLQQARNHVADVIDERLQIAERLQAVKSA